MIEFNKTTLLYGLFNQYVFDEAKMNVKLLKEYYNNDLITKDNTLIKKLVNIIDKYRFNDITEALFYSILDEDGKSEDEIKSIISKIKEYKEYTKDQAGVFKKTLKHLCYKAYAGKIKRTANDDIVTYVESFKEFEYKSNYSDTLVIKKFNELDITGLIDYYSGEGYKSQFKFINESFTCGGYIPGQLVMVVAAPSVGKSLFLQGEAVNFIKQGKRVHYLAMGDLNELDIVNRITCMIARKPQRQIESDLATYFEMYKHVVGDLLGITPVPSGVVKPTEYVKFMFEGKLDEYDILMVDYDSNFAKDSNLSMYDQYGEAYDLLTQLTRKGKLVFVACQPTKASYNNDILSMDSIGESSRKIHIADVIITISRNWESGMPIGKFNIAKSRRGCTGYNPVQPWIRTNEGLFFACSDDFYLKYMTDKRLHNLFSYNDLEIQDILINDLSQITKKGG